MGADILVAAELVTEALDEDGSRGNRCAEPVTVMSGIPGDAQEGPCVRQSPLFIAKGLGIEERLRPIVQELSHKTRGRQ